MLLFFQISDNLIYIIYVCIRDEFEVKMDVQATGQVCICVLFLFDQSIIVRCITSLFFMICVHDYIVHSAAVFMFFAKVVLCALWLSTCGVGVGTYLR
jgi:hypothetical protein